MLDLKIFALLKKWAFACLFCLFPMSTAYAIPTTELCSSVAVLGDFENFGSCRNGDMVYTFINSNNTADNWSLDINVGMFPSGEENIFNLASSDFPNTAWSLEYSVEIVSANVFDTVILDTGGSNTVLTKEVYESMVDLDSMVNPIAEVVIQPNGDQAEESIIAASLRKIWIRDIIPAGNDVLSDSNIVNAFTKQPVPIPSSIGLLLAGGIAFRYLRKIKNHEAA